MGIDRIVDKTIRPLGTAITLTPASFTAPEKNIPAYGALVMGNYKGSLAFLDLNKIGNEPLVLAEQQYILGILNGREEGYDLRTITVPVTALAGTPLNAGLTIPGTPTTVVAYINAVELAVAIPDATAGFTLNWHCSLWPDRAAVPSAFGQPFRTAAQALIAVNCAPAAIVPLLVDDEFGPVATAWVVTNKPPLLRLPGGTVITFTVLTDTAAPTLATACTLSLFGFLGKSLVG